jgi:hypothetical protein
MSKNIVISRADLLRYMVSFGACEAAEEWVTAQALNSAEDIYNACNQSDWLDLFLDQVGHANGQCLGCATRLAAERVTDEDVPLQDYERLVCDKMRKAVPWSKVVKLLTS